jgi:NAD(P)H dehydrogenase (quinone)
MCSRRSVYGVARLDEAGFAPIAERLRTRMRTLATTPPVPYGRQNGGDYLNPSMQLKPGLGDPGASGFALHISGETNSQLVRDHSEAYHSTSPSS